MRTVLGLLLDLFAIVMVFACIALGISAGLEHRFAESIALMGMSTALGAHLRIDAMNRKAWGEESAGRRET